MSAASERPLLEGEDFWVCSSFGMGDRHDRVTPESLAEVQPFVSPSQTVVCFDGRIDNRSELARFCSTEIRACERDTSDAALIAAAYERLGERCVAEINGDFALAVLDSARQQLVLARDVMSARCLYYCPLPAALLFASNIKSLLADPRIGAVPDEDGLAAYVLNNWCDDSRTCFKGIFSVPAGHMLVCTRDGMSVREHWTFDPARELRFRSFAEYCERFRSLFEQSVRRRLRSAHPIAVAVSGGVDSSAIFCQAAALVRRESLPVELRGIAMTFPEGTAADEESFLGDIERAYDTRITRLPVSHLRFMVNAGAIVRHLEIPAVVWQTQSETLELARRSGCRVILNGFFGDQMLFDRGYLVDLAFRGRWLKVRHHLAEFAAWMTDVEPGFFEREFWQRIVRALPPRWLFRLAKRHIGRQADALYAPWFSKEFKRRAFAHLSARLVASRRFANRHAEQYYRHATAGHYVSNVRRQHGAGLMHGVDVRYPFRDRDLVAFLMAVPGDIVNWQGVPKGLLRHALIGVLPEAVRNRRWKADFTAFHNDALVRDHDAYAHLLSGDCLIAQSGLLDRAVLDESVGSVATTITHNDTALPGWALSDLAGMELWFQSFFGNTPHASVDPTTVRSLPVM